MSIDTFALGPDLSFEHVGTMVLDNALLLVDVQYLPPRFAGAVLSPGGNLRLGGVEIRIAPGTWQVLTAHATDATDATDSTDARAPAFVLLAHDSELAHDLPLDHAEAVAMIRVDSGRITAVDPDLRHDPVIQTAVLEAPRDQVPCMLTPLDESGQPRAIEPRGALLDLDREGTFEVYATRGEPRTAVFLAIHAD